MATKRKPDDVPTTAVPSGAAPARDSGSPHSPQPEGPPALSFQAFLKELHHSINVDGQISKVRHHPDMHGLGAGPGQCPKCDPTMESARQMYEMRDSRTGKPER